MIQLKRCNYITGDPNELGFAVNDIVKFLENDGRNYLLFAPFSNNEKKNFISTSIKYVLDNKFIFDGYNQFSEIITNDSNLFRVDLLVFDFYHMTPWVISDYKKIIDTLNIDHIIMAKEYHYKTSDDVNDFLIRKEYKDLNKSEVHITDNINKWSSTLNSLSVSYIRDKKIDNLFGNKD